MARTDFLVEYIVGLIELGKTWCTIDNGNGIDVVELLLAVIDDGT